MTAAAQPQEYEERAISTNTEVDPSGYVGATRWTCPSPASVRRQIPPRSPAGGIFFRGAGGGTGAPAFASRAGKGAGLRTTGSQGKPLVTRARRVNQDGLVHRS